VACGLTITLVTQPVALVSALPPSVAIHPNRFVLIINFASKVRNHSWVGSSVQGA